MKKLLSIICALVMCMTVNVSADSTIDLDLQFTSEEIIIDGENTENDWKTAANITLTKENTGTWAGMDAEEHILPVDTYLMWNNEGIYVFADVTDSDPVFDGARDCFEISFNPGGLIPKEDELQGMFFMFWPYGEGGNVRCTRHNIDEETKHGIEAYDVEAKYKPTEKGWTIEALIPWHYICDEAREVYVHRRKTDNLLADFEHKEGEFLTATICRLNGNAEKQYSAVYRTCTDNIGENFYTDSYNVVLNLKGAPKVEESTSFVDTAVPNDTAADINSQGDSENSDNSITTIIIIAAVVAAVAVAALIILRKKSKK